MSLMQDEFEELPKTTCAEEMTKAEFCEVVGIEVPLGDDPLEPGYLITFPSEGKTDAEGNYSGPISWVTKTDFEAAYSAAH